MSSTTLLLTTSQAPQATLAYKVITPRNSMREMAALEAAMRGLVLDEQHPVALELAGTAAEQMWIIRSTTAEALNHACRQLRARYPQVAFVALEAGKDPLRLDASETVSVIELTPGAESFVPLHTWDEKTLDKEGTDPLLGVLAAIEHLPEDMRAIAQLAIVPAPVNWAGEIGSRKAVEHPLEQEREQRRAEMFAARGGSFSWTTIIGLASILFGLYLWRLFRISLPPWVASAATSLLHGHLPTLPAGLKIQFYGGIILLFVCLFLLYVVYDQVRKRARKKPTRLIDPRVVSQRTEQLACRVRLRLYVIGPGPQMSMLAYCRRRLPVLLRAARRYRAGRAGRTCFALLLLRRQALLAVHNHRVPGVVANAFVRLWGRVRRLGPRCLSFLWGGLRVSARHPIQTVRAAPGIPVRLGKRVSARVLGARVTHLASLMWQAIQKERDWRNAQAAQRAAVTLRMVAAYRQFHRGSGGYLVPRPISLRAARRLFSTRRGRLRYRRHGWQVGVERSLHYWSVTELSGAWHLLQALDLPHAGLVATRAARTLPIPPDVAELAQGAPVIGHAKHGEYDIPFAFTREWLQLHGLILGKSGEGKSSLLLHIAEAAMQSGGMVFIDPDGDNIPRILRRVPPHRNKDVVVVDLSDLLYCVGINPLDYTLGRGRDKSIADLLEILSHLYLRSWGTRMENSFEFALRTLWEANRYLCLSDTQNGAGRQYTLLDVLPLYTSESFCHSLLQDIRDPYIHRWWREYFEPLPLYMKRDIINPVATKVAKFESEIARRIVGQPRSSINLAEIIREGKILLIRLAKGTVGADAAPLLGATLLGLITVCLEEQGVLAEEKRALFPILIDEFQTLEGVDWSILAQLRKYGATFFLATQSLEYLQKLDALLLPTVLANVRQIYSFNLSAQDAWTIHRELAVEAEDIINLDSHMCYVKLKHAAQRRPTFSLNLDLPPAPTEEQVERAEGIVRDSQKTYATPAGEVDRWLLESVARQRLATATGTTTIEAEPVEALDQAPELTAARPDQRDQPGKTHPPRGAHKGDNGNGQRDRADSKSHKPQVAATPAGDPRSTPALFANESADPPERAREKEE